MKVFIRGEFTHSVLADAAARKRGDLQAELYNVISKHLHPPLALETLVRSRVERWTRAGLVTVPQGIAARRAERTLARIRNTCPPCVVWAVVRTWFNGWCTHRRFQDRRRNSCLLSCDCGGEDSIEHYLRCAVVRQVAVQKLRLEHILQDPGYLLLLDGGYDDDSSIALAASLLYGVYSATNQLRHHACHVSGEVGAQTLWCAIRKAGLQSRRLAGILKEIWAT